MHTRGGGVTVQFTDIEKLNHASPTKTLTRYRGHVDAFLLLSVIPDHCHNRGWIRMSTAPSPCWVRRTMS